MSSDWKSMRLGDLISIKGGMTYKSDLVGTGSSLLAGMGVVSNSERFLKTGLRVYSGSCSEIHKLLAGDLVIATRQQSDRMPILGFPAIVPESLNKKELYAATNLYKVSLTDLIDRNFLFWLLRGDEYKRRIICCSKGTTVRMITKEAIEDFEFSLPPLPEQTAIASFLDSLEDRIFFLRETNATLESIAEALFKSWFVDFDPVRAKMEGRTPEGMDEATAALFPDSFEESALGLVPKGWRVGNFAEVATVASGKRPSSRSDSKTETDWVPLYGGAGLIGYTSESLFDSLRILTGRVGTLGKVNVAYPPFWASDNVLVVTPKSSAFHSFVLNWLKEIDVHSLNRGSTQPLLTQRDLGAQIGVVPPAELLEAYEENVSVMYESIREVELRIATLMDLRDTLLPRLISGQLRLPEIEEIVTEAS